MKLPVKAPLPPASQDYALTGLLAVGLATPLAVLCVPTDYAPAGALFLSGGILAAGLVIVPAVAVFRWREALFRGEYLLMGGLVYWLLLDLLQGAYDLNAARRESVQAALGAVGLFAAGVWCAGLHAPWRLPGPVLHAARIDLSTSTLFGALLVCFGLALFRFAQPCGFDPVVMISSLAGNRWSAPWAGGQLHGWNAFIHHLSYFGYLLPALIVLLAHDRRSWLAPQVVTACLLSLIVSVFLAHGGGRRVIGVMAGSAMICWTLLQGRQATYRILAALGVVCVLVLGVMEVMLAYRSVGYGKMLGGAGEQEIEYRHLHVDDNFLRLAQVIELVPETHDYVYHRMVVFVLIRPVPRVVWEGKPVDPGFDLAASLGQRDVSLTCSAVGEWYLSAGWLGVFLGGWLYGRLAGMYNSLLSGPPSLSRCLVYALGAMALFAGLRGMIDLVLMSYMLLAWVGLSFVMAPPLPDGVARPLPSDSC
jgi:hypothetical protein